MKSRSDVWLRALEDLGAQCSVSTQRTADTFAMRVEREGDSFMKVTLPQFAKDLERSLDSGFISPELFTGFGRSKRRIRFTTGRGEGLPNFRSMKMPGGTPKFLGEFLDLVFDDEEEFMIDSLSDVEPNGSKYVSTTHDGQTLGLAVNPADPDEGWSLSYVRDAVHELPVRIRTFESRDARLRAGRAVRAVRQLCLMFNKERELCSEANIVAALNAFMKTDQELVLPLSTRER
jgi:hypothetical protein